MNLLPVSIPHYSSITLYSNLETAAVLPSTITSISLTCLQPATSMNFAQGHDQPPRMEVLSFVRDHHTPDRARVINSSWQQFDYEKNLLNRLLLTLLHNDVQALGLERAGELRESIINAKIPIEPEALTFVLIQYAKNFPQPLRAWFPQAWQRVRNSKARKWEKLMALLENKNNLVITRLALLYLLNINSERGYSYPLVSRALSASYATPPLSLKLWINHILKNAPCSNDSRTKWLGMHLREASGLQLLNISSFQLIKGLWDAGIKLDFNLVDHALTLANLDLPPAELERFKHAWLNFKSRYQPIKLTRKRRGNSRVKAKVQQAGTPEQRIDRAMLGSFLNNNEFTFINSWEKLMCCLWCAGEDPAHITLYRLFKKRPIVPLPPENTHPTGGVALLAQNAPASSGMDADWQDIFLPPLSGFEDLYDLPPGS